MTPIKKIIHILNYLKWNSNKENPLERKNLTDDEGLSKVLGGKSAQTRAFKALHEGFNTDYDERYIDEEDWRVIISGLKLDTKEKNNRLGSMYYNHVFSHDEIDLILEGIWSIKTIDNKQAEILTEKIKKKLGDRFYDEDKRALFTDILKEQESTFINKKTVHKNLRTIQEAVTSNKQIKFNLYSWYSGKDPSDVQFIPRDKNPNIVSPYQIIFNDGKYYLLANTEEYGHEKVEKNRMSVWRVDLMDEIEIQKEEITEDRRVKNLSNKVGKTFNNEHISMAYDDPVKIKMKISHYSGKKRSLDYKFIYDWFRSYKFLEEDHKDYYGHIIEVKATKFAIVNWALKYNQEVEILDPPEIRQAIKDKNDNLNNKYR